MRKTVTCLKCGYYLCFLQDIRTVYLNYRNIQIGTYSCSNCHTDSDVHMEEDEEEYDVDFVDVSQYVSYLPQRQGVRHRETEQTREIGFTSNSYWNYSSYYDDGVAANRRRVTASIADIKSKVTTVHHFNLCIVTEINLELS